MKRILINATHNEEIRVALCKDHHLYDFDLENRTREQKKANIYKGHITRVEPSLEAAFVEYGSARQGFLPLREIAGEYLHGNIREDGIKQLIKEGDEVIVQVEKEERGNKGAALSTYISLAGRYLVLMPNNAKAGGISRQISGKVREEMKQIIASLNLPKGMSVIVRTAGLGKGFDDLQNDLDHLLDIWASIQEQNRTRPSPCLVHQEAGVVTRAVRDYLRDDIGEVWIDSENAYNEAANFIAAVMPSQMSKLRKYTDYEPLFARFGIERQIETAYQREVRLPSGGSIVIDQTEALVSIDINSSKSTKGSDVAETAYHTNLEAADEIARQLRLRDMGGLIVIDFIDMNDPRHQKDVEKRLVEATRHDRARVQFAEISKFGLLEMSRQRLRPSLEEATGYICPRCHGNGLIRDLRSLSLSIMRQIEQIALKERMGEIQAEVPTDIAAFLLNEKRESLVYLEQDSGTRITILPHAHLESPNFSLHFNPDGFAPSSYERIADTEEKETVDRGYEVNWQNDNEKALSNQPSRWQEKGTNTANKKAQSEPQKPAPADKPEPQVAAWLSNLFAPKPQAKLAGSFGTQDVAAAIESIVNNGGVSLGATGSVNEAIKASEPKAPAAREEHRPKRQKAKKDHPHDDHDKHEKKAKKDTPKDKEKEKEYPKRDAGSRRESRGEVVRGETLTPKATKESRNDKKERSDRSDKARPEKARQKTVSDEVVLHISQNDIKEEPAAVVHLSLDDSKPKKAAKARQPAAATIDDEVKADAVEALKVVEAAEVETAATAGKADAVDKAANETAALEDAKAATKADADKAETVVKNESAPPATDMQPITKATKAIADDQLLAKARDIAAKLGKAANDPRVVRQAAAELNGAITGTAGEFIARSLSAPTGAFISDFIAALATRTSVFDFTNFGYAPLDSDYLAAFKQATNAAASANAAQGKTAVTPRAIGKRAANDPRGQHPDYLASLNATTPSESPLDDTPVAAGITEESATSVQPENQQPQEIAQDATDAPSDAEPTMVEQVFEGVKAVVDEAAANIREIAAEIQSNIVDAIVATADVPSDLPTKADAQAKADDSEPATEAEAQAETDAQTAAEADSKAEATPKKGSQIKQIRANQKAEKKPKANSYKDMIENVAGQLQPQQIGILNLMTTKTPKAPKARTRKTSKKDNKPKSEVRKISKPVVDETTSES